MAAQAEQLLESRAGPRRTGGPSNTARRTRDAHPYYQDFAAYGDATAYKRRLPALRRSLKK